MPPVFGPMSLASRRLWSWSPGRTTKCVAVGDGEDGELLALHELLDQDLGAGGAEAVALEHVVDRAVGVVERLADDDALAGGEPGGLDDDGRAEAAGGRLGGGDAGVDLGARGRDARRRA